MEEFCPCCGQHCALSNPGCERGKAYAEDGKKIGADCHAQSDLFMQMRKKRYAVLDTENKLICNIRDMGHTVRAMSDGKASQSRILILLHTEGLITQSVLTELLHVQPGTVSEVIGKLEKAELVERIVSENDRRTCTLRLTEKGKEQALQAIEARKNRYEEMFACLTEHEKSNLLALLEKVNDDWQGRYGDKHIERRGGYLHEGQRGERQGGHLHGHGRHGGHGERK